MLKLVSQRCVRGLIRFGEFYAGKRVLIITYTGLYLVIAALRKVKFFRHLAQMFGWCPHQYTELETR